MLSLCFDLWINKHWQLRQRLADLALLEKKKGKRENISVQKVMSRF